MVQLWTSFKRTGKRLTLTAPVRRGIYRASARDAAGNRYMVQWPIKDSILAMPAEDRPEDDSEWRDWSDPEMVKLVESAE